mgnify:CR=1 FL=1
MFRYFKNLYFITIFFIFLSQTAYAEKNIFLKNNDKLFNITIINQKNEKIQTYKIFEKKNKYLINFWATWCQPCKKELPDLEKILKNLEDINLKIYIVSIDKKNIEEQKLFLKKNNISLLTPFFDPDMKFFNSLNLRGIPTTILIKQNRVIRKKEGIIPFNKNVIEELKEIFN